MMNFQHIALWEIPTLALTKNCYSYEYLNKIAS